jgi:endoglucanase
VALFVTEFGATNANGGLDGVVCLDEAQIWNDWLKQRKISWTAWKLDDCEPDSTCLLKPGTPVGGGWTSEHLRGHALFVRGRMQE